MASDELRASRIRWAGSLTFLGPVGVEMEIWDSFMVVVGRAGEVAVDDVGGVVVGAVVWAVTSRGGARVTGADAEVP